VRDGQHGVLPALVFQFCMRETETDSLARCSLLQAGDSEYNACLDNIKELHRYGSMLIASSPASLSLRLGELVSSSRPACLSLRVGELVSSSRRLPLPPVVCVGMAV